MELLTRTFTPEWCIWRSRRRGFPSFALWRDAVAKGAGLLWRVSDSFILPVDERPDDGAYLSHLNGKKREERITARVIEYSVTTTLTGAEGTSEQTSELFWLITTLTDPSTAPALELAEAYQNRRTSETIFKHIKIEQRGRRTATLRSHSPAMIEQELWAMLCVYQALREMVCDTAREHGPPPDHVSFKQVPNATRRSAGTAISPGRLTRTFRDLQADLAREAVKPRPGRSAPRATKRSTPGHRTLRPDERPTSRTVHVHVHRLPPAETPTDLIKDRRQAA